MGYRFHDHFNISDLKIFALPCSLLLIPLIVIWVSRRRTISLHTALSVGMCIWLLFLHIDSQEMKTNLDKLQQKVSDYDFVFRHLKDYLEELNVKIYHLQREVNRLDAMFGNYERRNTQKQEQSMLWKFLNMAFDTALGYVGSFVGGVATNLLTYLSINPYPGTGRVFQDRDNSVRITLLHNHQAKYGIVA